jgi:hypothetical protein
MQEQSSPLKKITRREPQENSPILDHCEITKEEIAEFATGIVEELNANLFYAFLCQLSTFISTPAIVFSPIYCIKIQENGKEQLSVNYYGNEENYDTAIIPVKVADYFGIAIFEKGASIQYFDPYYNDITPETRQHLRTVVQSIVEGDTIVRVRQVKSALFNKATTLNEAKIICCVIVERYLMHSKQTYIDDINLIEQRDNIVTNVLKTIITGVNIYTNLNEQLYDEGSYKSWQMRRIRDEESTEKRENRLRLNKERTHFSQQEESDEEKEIRLSARRTRYQKAYEKRRNSIYLQGRQTDDDLKEHRLNPMDTVCTHCGALHFYEEVTERSKNSFNDCCRSAIFIAHFLKIIF